MGIWKKIFEIWIIHMPGMNSSIIKAQARSLRTKKNALGDEILSRIKKN